MSQVARRFSRAAQTYERGAGLHRHVAARLVEMMPDPGTIGEGHLLEVGCGTGVLSERLRQRYPGAPLCLLDAAPAMVGSVRERWGGEPGMEFAVSDIMAYRALQPYAWIFSSSALHWVSPLATVFSRLRGHLVAGGGLCFALMVDGTLGELHALRQRIAPGKMPAGQLPRPEEVEEALRQAGFTLVAREVETIQTHYHSASDFLGTIHAQGLTGGAVSRSAVALTRSELKHLRRDYDVAFRDASGGVYATFVVQYVTAMS